MGRRLAAFASLPSHFITTLIGETTTYRLRYTYRPRMNAWYCDLFASDGTKLAMGRRLSPKSTPWSNFVFAGQPADGSMICTGPANYKQDDLGDSLFIAWYSDEEIEEFAAELEADA